MIGERRTQRKHWSWLALVWLGAFLMLGALTLPAQAASGYVAPADPDAPGLSFLAPRSFSLSTEVIGVRDMPLGYWAQQKDFARKDFVAPAPSNQAPLAQETPSPAPTSGASPDDLEGAPAGPGFFATLDRFASHIAMRVEERRRLMEPGTAQPPHGRATSSPVDEVTAPSPDLSRGLTPAFRREILAAARWCKRTYSSDPLSSDADEDPAGDPPPATQPLLIAPLSFDTSLSLHASYPLVTVPEPILRPRIAVHATSQTPPHLLAWPALRIRPPPGFAPPAGVFPLV